MSAATILAVLDGLLAAMRLAKTFGINFDEVRAAQDQADAEGRELSAAERQAFVDQAQDAIDEL